MVGMERRQISIYIGGAGKVDYAKGFNQSNGRRLRGHTDTQGNYHDID
jgi:hypothetical protein